MKNKKLPSALVWSLQWEFTNSAALLISNPEVKSNSFISPPEVPKRIFLDNLSTEIDLIPLCFPITDRVGNIVYMLNSLRGASSWSNTLIIPLSPDAITLYTGGSSIYHDEIM